MIEVTADGSRRVRYDFIKNIDRAKALVRLDGDGRERPFDRHGDGFDRGDLPMCRPGDRRPGSSRARAVAWQWVEGFASWAKQPPQRRLYRCYLGSVESGWVYARQNGEVSWLTAAVAEKKPTAVAFIGGTGYGPGKAELWCDGKRLLEFETSQAEGLPLGGRRS